MATTGYHTRHGSHICRNCARDADLPTGNLREVSDSQYRHGEGGGPCAQCGIDTLDILARNALRGRTDPELVIPDDVEDQVDPVEATASIIDESFSAVRVSIALAPGVEPERNQVAPGVTQVEHPDDAAETLHVDFTGEDPPSIQERQVEKVEAALEAWDWETEITAGPVGSGVETRIRAVPGEGGLGADP